MRRRVGKSHGALYLAHAIGKGAAAGHDDRAGFAVADRFDPSCKLPLAREAATQFDNDWTRRDHVSARLPRFRKSGKQLMGVRRRFWPLASDFDADGARHNIELLDADFDAEHARVAQDLTGDLFGELLNQRHMPARENQFDRIAD